MFPKQLKTGTETNTCALFISITTLFSIYTGYPDSVNPGAKHRFVFAKGRGREEGRVAA